MRSNLERVANSSAVSSDLPATAFPTAHLRCQEPARSVRSFGVALEDLEFGPGPISQGIRGISSSEARQALDSSTRILAKAQRFTAYPSPGSH